jgi:hypothetical protein
MADNSGMEFHIGMKYAYSKNLDSEDKDDPLDIDCYITTLLAA